MTRDSDSRVVVAPWLQQSSYHSCAQYGYHTRRNLDEEQVDGFYDAPTFIMGISMGGALAVQTIRAVVRPQLCPRFSILMLICFSRA